MEGKNHVGTLIEECLNITGVNFGGKNPLALSAYYP